MRKLASIRKIAAVRPIPSADSIECAVVGGWTVVIKKGEFQAGDLAVYCEIDSWIPHGLAPFLSKGPEPREYRGVKGERLSTVKFRGQLSQGLLLPLDPAMPPTEGLDVTDQLGIIYYASSTPGTGIGDSEGKFPYVIPKTDQERIQNLCEEFAQWQTDEVDWEVTEKLDGSSMTVYVHNEDSGVCSRNLKLKDSVDSRFWKVAHREQLLASLSGSKRNLALQGELIGEGIQKNPYNLKDQKFYVFDIFDIDNNKYLSPSERIEFCEKYNISHVPVISNKMKLDESNGMATVEQVLQFAEGKSILNNKTEREGIVFKSVLPGWSFKAISNKFLLKNKN